MFGERMVQIECVLLRCRFRVTKSEQLVDYGLCGGMLRVQTGMVGVVKNHFFVKKTKSWL